MIGTLYTGLERLHETVFETVESVAGTWLMGLIARFAFAAVLLFYFLNSARTKVGEGLAGFFSVSDNAYYQIVLPAVEAAGGDVSNVSFFPWGLVVYAGTYAEFILPVLIVLGLFTRIAALGMLVFIGVQSLVDVTVHQVGDAAGAWFDRFADGVIADQRLLWAIPLIYLVIKGAGAISLDGIGRMVRQRSALSPA